MQKIRKLRLPIILVLVLALVGEALYIGWGILKNKKVTPVKVFGFDVVGMTEYWGDTRESVGEVSTDRIQTIYLSDTQTVSEIAVTEGQQVKKGDLLMSFDTTLSQLELERKDLEIQKLELDLEDAQKELQRINWMVPMSTPPETEPTEPTEETEPDLGTPLGESYRFPESRDRGMHNGTSEAGAFICWIRNDAALSPDFIQSVLLERAKLLVGYVDDEPEEQTEEPTEETEEPEETEETDPSEETDPTEETDPSEVTDPTEETTSSEETTLPEETTSPEETTLPEETTSPEETTLPEETASPEETTLPEETASPEEITPSEEPVIPETVQTEAPPVEEQTENPETEPETTSLENAALELFSDLLEEVPEEEGIHNPISFYTILKITRENKPNAEKLVWIGLYVGEDGTIRMFDASHVEDYSIQRIVEEPTEPTETEPVIDYFGSGYTWTQIQQMKADQQKKIQKLELDIRVAKAAYKIMERELSDGKIYAEIDGKVLTVRTEEEAKLDNQPLLKLSGGGGFFVSASIGELDRSNLSIGQEVTVSDWETGGSYTAVVHSIGDFPASGGGMGGMYNPNSTNYPFTVYVDESADLRAGSYVSVQYSAASTQSGIYLQNPFLRTVGGRSFVYVRGEDGLLEERTVTTGKSVWGSYTEILDGLTVDDLIAFPYGKNVKPGQPAEKGELSDLYGY